MATESMIKLFQQRVQEFGKLDKHSIYRDDLGKFSLEGKLKNRIDKMLTMLLIEEQYLHDFPDEILQNIVSNLQDMRTTVERQRTRPDDDYINRNSDILANFIHRIDQINSYMPHFKTAKFDDIGVDDLSIMKDQVRQIIDAQLADAKNIRNTAAGVAIPEAQNEFSDAAKSNLKQAWFWGIISIGFIYNFILFVQSFRTTDLTNFDTLKLIIFGSTRLTVLFALGAVIAFCLKILRAQLHMKERNAHRGRLSNSLGAFVASTSENQRDLVLSILIQEISSFGKSGLLQKDDDSMSLPKNILDSFLKNRSPSS